MPVSKPSVVEPEGTGRFSRPVWRETRDVEEEELRHRKDEYEYAAKGRERGRRYIDVIGEHGPKD